MSKLLTAALSFALILPIPALAHFNNTSHSDCNGGASRTTSVYRGYRTSTYTSNNWYGHANKKHECEDGGWSNLEIGLVVFGVVLMVGWVIYYNWDDFSPSLSQEDIKNYPIQPMFYMDDKEQKLGLRYKIEF